MRTLLNSTSAAFSTSVSAWFTAAYFAVSSVMYPGIFCTIAHLLRIIETSLASQAKHVELNYKAADVLQTSCTTPAAKLTLIAAAKAIEICTITKVKV